MNKEAVEKRLAELEKLKATALAQVNFYCGQESELRFWLTKIIEKEATALKPVTLEVVK